MGCNTCNQSSGLANEINEGQTFNIIPSDLAGGNLLFRLIAFLVIVIAIPLIILVLVGQIFISIFLNILNDSRIDILSSVECNLNNLFIIVNYQYSNNNNTLFEM